MGRLLARRIEQVEVRAAVYKTRREKEHVLDLEIASLMALIGGVETDPETMLLFLDAEAGYRHPGLIWQAMGHRIQSRQYDGHIASLFASMQADFLAWASPPAA